MSRKPVITTTPPTTFFGPAVEAAEARRTTAIAARDDAQEKVSAMLAGGRRFNPFVIGSRDEPSDMEREAIARDEAAMDAALATGEDVTGIGTPNLDTFKRELATAEAVLRACERAVDDAEAQLVEAFKTERTIALSNVRPALLKGRDRQLAGIDEIVAGKHTQLEAEAVLAFLDQLDRQPLDRLDFIPASTTGEQPIVGRNFVSVSFDAIVATLRAQAEPPAMPEIDNEQADEHDHDEAPAGTSEFSLDNRFSSELPRRTRSRLISEGAIK